MLTGSICFDYTDPALPMLLIDTDQQELAAATRPISGLAGLDPRETLELPLRRLRNIVKSRQITCNGLVVGGFTTYLRHDRPKVFARWVASR